MNRYWVLLLLLVGILGCNESNQSQSKTEESPEVVEIPERFVVSPREKEDWEYLQALPAAQAVNESYIQMREKKDDYFKPLRPYRLAQIVPFANYPRPVINRWYAMTMGSRPWLYFKFSTDSSHQVPFDPIRVSGIEPKEVMRWDRGALLELGGPTDIGPVLTYGYVMFDQYLQHQLLKFTGQPAVKQRYFEVPAFMQDGPRFQKWFEENHQMRRRDFRILILAAILSERESHLQKHQIEDYQSELTKQQERMLEQLKYSTDPGPRLADLRFPESEDE